MNRKKLKKIRKKIYIKIENTKKRNTRVNTYIEKHNTVGSLK